MGDLSLLLCPCLTTAAFHISEELLGSPGLFLREEAWSGESELALKGQGLLWCEIVKSGQPKLCPEMFLPMKRG